MRQPGQPSPRIKDTTPSWSPHLNRPWQVFSEIGALSLGHYPETSVRPQLRPAPRQSHDRPHGQRGPPAGLVRGIKPKNNRCGTDCLRAAGPLILRLLLGLRCLDGEAMISLAHCLAKATETGSESCPDQGATPSLAAGICTYSKCNPQLPHSSSCHGEVLNKGRDTGARSRWPS